MKKHLFTLFAALCLCLSLLPTAALAARSDITGINYIDEQGATQMLEGYTTLNSDTTSLESGFYATNYDYTLDSVSVASDAKLILSAGDKLTIGSLTGTEGSLSIYGGKPAATTSGLDINSGTCSITSISGVTVTLYGGTYTSLPESGWKLGESFCFRAEDESAEDEGEEGIAYTYSTTFSAGATVVYCPDVDEDNEKYHKYTDPYTDGKCLNCGHVCNHNWPPVDGNRSITEDGKCSYCGWQYPVHFDGKGWNETLDANLNGSTAKLYADINDVMLGQRKAGYTIDLNGHTLTQADQNYVDNDNIVIKDSSEEGGGTIKGLFKITGGSVQLHAGVTLADGIKTTVTGATLADYLAPDTAYANIYGAVLDGSVSVLEGTVKIIEHTHDFTGGTCECGAADTGCKTDGCTGSYNVKGFCSVNDSHYQPATLNDDGVYEISNAGQLYWFAAQVNGGSNTINAKLTDNIKINDSVLKTDGTLNTANSANFRQWTPIGNEDTEYCGTFDGNGKTISGLYYSGSDEYVGLFGYIGEDSDDDVYGAVQSVTLKDSYFYSERSEGVYVGGIAGENSYGTIMRCAVNAVVSGKAGSGSAAVGGIAGDNYGKITNCYNTGTVSGSSSGYTAYVGGVVGYNGASESKVTNCYHTGAVSGSAGGGYSAYVGGVAGNIADGSISNCYYQKTADNTIAAIGQYGGHTENVEAKTAADFASGEVTWLLNGKTATPETGNALAWYQKLGTGGDAAPTLDSDRGTVYHGYADSCAMTYSNTALSDTPTHDWGTDGKCQNDGCDASAAAYVYGTTTGGDSTKEVFYATVEEALTALNVMSREEYLAAFLYLCKDCTLPEGATITSTAETTYLDLSGHTLTGDLTVATDKQCAMNNGTLSGSVTVNSGALNVYDGGKVSGDVTVNGGTLKVYKTSTGNGGEVTGTITVTQRGYLTVNDGGKVGTVNVSGGIGVYGGTVGELTIDANARASLSGGTFDKVTYGGGYVGSLLKDGYAFKDSDGKWYDNNNYFETSISSQVTVTAVPFTDVSITTTDDKTSFTYGESITLTVSGVDGATYQWYTVSGDTEAIITDETGETYSPADLNFGEHTFRVKVTKEGYTKSAEVTVTVNKAALDEGMGDYIPPSPQNTTYNGEDQNLLSLPGSTDIGTFYYSLDSGETKDWSTAIPKAKNAGDYTVYYYVAGDKNHTNTAVASVTTTINQRKLTSENAAYSPLVFIAQTDTLTYNGQPQTPTFKLELKPKPESKPDGMTVESVTIETLAEGTDYTVTVTPQTNVGERYEITFTGKGNYTGTATKTWSIEKAAAPELTATDAEVLYTKVPYTVDLSKVITGMPEDAGNVSYSLPSSASEAASISESTLTMSDTYKGTAGASIAVPVIVSSANYADATVIMTIKLVAKEHKTLTDVRIDSWTYDGTANEPTYTKPENATNLKVEYKGKTETDSAYSETVPTAAGDYTVKVSYETDTEIWSGTADFTIERKGIAGAAITLYDESLTYDGNQKTRTVQSVKLGDKPLTADTDYTVSGDLTGKNAGGYTVTVTGQGNYTGTANTTWTITKKPITANVTVAEKEYDGTNTATVTVSFDLNDSNQPVAGDSISVTGVTGTFTDKNVGTGKTVTVGSDNVTITGSGSENYKVSFPSGVTIGVIKAKPVTATVTVAEKTYDGTTDATVTAKVESGLIAGDEIVISGLTGTFADANAGAGKTVTVDSGAAAVTGAENYTVTIPATASGNINKATLPQPTFGTVSAAGKTLGEVDWSLDGAQAELTWDDGSYTEIEQGKSYAWTLTPINGSAGNYNDLHGTAIPWPVPARPSGGSGGGSSSATTVTVPVSSDHASVNVKATVSKGNATVEVSDKQIEKVIADHAGEVTLDVSGLKNVESATVPSHIVEKTNEAENTGLTVALPAGSVTLDETALGSVTENAKGKDVTVSVVSIPTSKLPTAVKNIIGMEPTVVAVVDVNVLVNGVKQSSFDGGKVTVSVPYTPKAGEDTSKLTVWFIRDDGTIENKGGYYDAEKKCFVFETEHLSQYLLVNPNEAVSFTDVPANAWYAASVNWASREGITGGIGEGKFGPDLSCTRAQIVTFLYRAAVAQGVDVSVGEDTNILSYTDALEVPEYAFAAFQWAVGAGIVQGADGKLMPGDDCTRGQIVTMLYRYAVATGKDVSVGEDTNILSYADALEVPGYAVAPFQWATGAGIVQGTDGKLLPEDSCTRAQIVTMLYRLLGE